MASRVKVRTLEGEELELDRAECVFLGRSRMAETGYDCSYRRWLQYEWGGTGLQGAKKKEDLVLGSALHWGMEVMLEAAYTNPFGGYSPQERGELVWGAGEAAKSEFLQEASKGLVMQWDEDFENLMPESAAKLVEEQAALAQALVVAFGLRHLEGIYERYELVATEPEIVWLLGQSAGLGKYFVMMSRPDAVLRDRVTGKLYVVSYKTTQKVDDLTHLKMEVDPQALTEMMAVRAWMPGEEVAGVLYYYFSKGTKGFDKGWQAKRYESPLIRPWKSVQMTGPSTPAQFAAKYEWWDQDPQGGWHKHTLGKYWQRVESYKEPGLGEWLGWLSEGMVQPGMGIDFLAQAVSDPQPVLRSIAEQEQWRRTELREEIGRRVDIEQIEAGILSPEDAFQKRTTACFDWQHTCPWFGVCHRGQTVEEGLANGRLRPREPNHPVEFGDGVGEEGEMVEELISTTNGEMLQEVVSDGAQIRD